jgi:hypothetical protein
MILRSELLSMRTTGTGDLAMLSAGMLWRFII